MYDIHCHILPAFDDGAADLDTALKMAEIAVADGITHLACTPHIYPGLYEHNSQDIQSAIDAFSGEIKAAGIPLTLTIGADIQMAPEIVGRLKDQTMPTINHSRYFLFEPPHHVAPLYFEEAVFEVLAAGYIPVITHPERLVWIEDCYEQFIRVAENGAWLQITAGSITGRFGERPKYWAERMLDEGIVHIIATDGHNLDNRAPILTDGVLAAAKFVGENEAQKTVLDRPRAVWENRSPDSLSKPPGFDENGNIITRKKSGLFKRWFARSH